MKSVRTRSFSGPYFPACRFNIKIYSVNLEIKMLLWVKISTNHQNIWKPKFTFTCHLFDVSLIAAVITLLRKSPYWVRMEENRDQKNFYAIIRSNPPAHFYSLVGSVILLIWKKNLTLLSILEIKFKLTAFLIKMCNIEDY